MVSKKTTKNMKRKKPIISDMSVRLHLSEDERYRLRIKVLKQKTTVVKIVSDFLLDYIKDEPGLEQDVKPETPG